MEHLRRLGFFILIVAVWGCLSPVQTEQLQEDLLEIEIHATEDTNTSSSRLLDPSKWTHDCHSCLVSHPGTSLGATVEKTRLFNLLTEGECLFSFSDHFAPRRLVSPNKRSPPLA